MTGGTPDRVVVINDRSAPVGGASNLALLLARMIEGAGTDVTFFAGDAPGEATPPRDTIHVGMTPLMQQGKARGFVSGLYNARARRALRELIETRDTPSTIYHVHGWSKILSPSIFGALAKVRERVVLHAHDYFLACPNGGFADYRRNEICSLKPMSTGCVTRQCDKRGYHEKLWRMARHLQRERLFATKREPAHIVAIHEDMLAYFEKAGIDRRRIVTIRNPVDPLLKPPAKPWAADKFVFIGRLEPEKGFEDAAKAARVAGLTLHVIGDGAGRALLESDYPEVVVHGWKSKAEMAPLMRGARAVVVSSRVPEPFGLAVAEAVTSGIPVVIAQGALLAREIAARGCGIAVRGGDIGAMAEAMRDIADNDALVSDFHRNCLRVAPAIANTPQSWLDALMELYGRVLHEAGQAAALKPLSAAAPVASWLPDPSRSRPVG